MNNKPGKSKVSPTGGDLEGAKENPELGESLKQVISLKAISLVAPPANKEQSKILPLTQSLYNPKFVAGIEQSRKEMKSGKGISIKVDDLWK